MRAYWAIEPRRATIFRIPNFELVALPPSSPPHLPSFPPFRLPAFPPIDAPM